MNIIVTDAGFHPNDTLTIPVPTDTDTDLAKFEANLPAQSTLCIDFPNFADGRGFSLARRLRQMGFAGRLRAKGLLADQYAMARRAGFDEVEIDNAMAKRQPQDHWLARANWRAHDYQARLRGRPKDTD